MRKSTTTNPEVVRGAMQNHAVLEHSLKPLITQVEEELLKHLSILEGNDTVFSFIAAAGKVTKLSKGVSGHWMKPSKLPEELKTALYETFRVVLMQPNPLGHHARLALVEQLVRTERMLSGEVQLPPAVPRDDDPLLSTTEAAGLLGYSRPYVAMLVDNGKLPAEVSVGNHRRIRRSEVLKYKSTHAPGTDINYRAAAQAAGMYDIPEEEYVKRLRRGRQPGATKKAKKK